MRHSARIGHPALNDPLAMSRRVFLGDTALGLGTLAFASLATAEGRTETPATPSGRSPTPAEAPLAAKSAPLFAKAKRVIFLFQAGAPSQLELFDHKPTLQKHDGQPVPAELVAGKRYAFINPQSPLLGPKFQFARHGQCGAELSEMLPGLARVVDDIAIVKSLVTDAFNHAPGQIMMNTGSPLFGRPSFGSWVLYGLGSESQELPGYVVLSSAKGTSGGASNWGSGFLPTIYAGVPFRSSGDPILYLSHPPGVDRTMDEETLATMTRLNAHRLGQVRDPEIATRIHAYEMAFRMQASAPELMDLSSEPAETLALYGAEPGKASYANNCLLARRLIERGIRFVQLFHEAWDHHGGLVQGIKDQTAATDRASSALVLDLKRRGLLEDTLVIWGGEFGRTPMVQGTNDGRDHHPYAFTMWLAGGGIRPGITLGSTDDLGFHAVEDRVHVHDLHATLLHLLGFDHTRLTYRFQGRDFRLTDVHGTIVDKLLA